MLFRGGGAGGGGGGGGGGEGRGKFCGAPMSTKDSRKNRLLNILRKSHGKTSLRFSGVVLFIAAVVGIIPALLREIFSPRDDSLHTPVSRNSVAHSTGEVMPQAPRMELGSSSVHSAHRQWRTVHKAYRTVAVVVRVIRFRGYSFLAYSLTERVHS